MKVKIRHIEKTCLIEEAYVKLIKKYIDTDKDVTILFDGRMKDYGEYFYNQDKRRHEIKIGLKKNKVSAYNQDRILKEDDQRYTFIETTLHELKHLMQHEESGRSFYNNDFGTNRDIKDNVLAIEYSQCELEAKEFEKKNILTAVDFYDTVVSRLEEKEERKK
jgi:hypothetical protein